MHDFETFCAKRSLAEYASLFSRYLKPCIGFDLQAPGGELPIGCSRLGGGPDLPEGFAWPCNAERPLDFVLQVNLADVVPHDTGAQLPRTGLLSFFYDLDKQPWGYDPKDLNSHRVCLFDAETRFVRHAPSDSSVVLSEAALRFWPSQSLPHPFSRIADQMKDAALASGLAWSDEQDEAYWDLPEAIFSYHAPLQNARLHRLGGYAHNVQGDMQLEAQLVTNGLYCGNQTGYADPRRPALEKSCHEWSLLLQLDSDDDYFMWGDSGMLYYWGRDRDLARADFSQTWMGLQCC